ncbi:hypothetical protein LGH83_04410 [Lichenihabitans sp. PAMC28606]|uniref:hypothetical protein n=1 Tax=Lichenihabitans sp. PAMC28606 TaxID=2880932 RepID=UPI001D0B3ADB|nr:hypothetical protein [Lichenihabitans sp. PAMC28606]UDL95469.1 hypothetical protein LGH83_04410 [Lichenihabitans sp. PAMC28606]
MTIIDLNEARFVRAQAAEVARSYLGNTADIHVEAARAIAEVAYTVAERIFTRLPDLGRCMNRWFLRKLLREVRATYRRTIKDDERRALMTQYGVVISTDAFTARLIELHHPEGKPV